MTRKPSKQGYAGSSLVIVVSALGALAACGGSSAPPPKASDDAPTPPASSASVTLDGGTPIETPVAPKSASDDVAPVDAGAVTSAPPESATAINTIEDCATFGKFPDAHVAADAGAGGPKVVVPWMVDPFGDKADKPGKTAKPSAKAPPDKDVEALRDKFRKCYAAAKKTDPTQSVGLSFSHKPKAGQHEVCVEVKRQEGKEAVTRVMATCMMQAIKEWAKVP